MENANPTAQDVSARTMPIESMPIGMAYVPWQVWQKIYNDEVALDRGTIFHELDLPFIGERMLP